MAIVVKDIAGGKEIPMAGGQKGRIFEIVGDTAYPTGGTVITAAQFGFTTLSEITGQVNAGRVLGFDAANSKLPCFVSGGAGAVLAEAANASDISGSVFRVLAIGS